MDFTGFYRNDRLYVINQGSCQIILEREWILDISSFESKFNFLWMESVSEFRTEIHSFTAHV